MRCLYIDTSSSFLYAGITEDEKLIVECQKNLGHDLSKEALPEIIQLFDKAKLNPQDIDKIIVVNGPGSFTGIRIGVTIAKVYAYSMNIPITTITSLEAMMLSAKEKAYHIPLINARRGYVFGAIYDEQNRPILPPQHLKIEELLQKLEDNNVYQVITNDEIEIPLEKQAYHPDILKIVQTFQHKECISPHIVNPNYLKKTEAEERRTTCF